MIDSVIEWRDGDKPGSWREDQGKCKALEPGVARERDPFAVGTLREAAVDASVLARVARRVRAEALELATCGKVKCKFTVRGLSEVNE